MLLTLATLGVLLCIPSSANAAWCEDKAPVPDFSEDHQPLFVPERMERPGLTDFMTDWNYIGRWGDWAEDSNPNDMAEKYWTAGAKWHVVLEGCTDPMRWDPEPKIYNMFWGWSKTIASFVLAAVFMGLFPETVGFFGHMMATVIDTLKETIFWQFFSAMVILGALWMGWQGLIAKRFTLTVQGAVWMCVSAALGMWVMASPQTFFGATVQISNVGAAGATNIMSSSVSGDPEQEYTCMKGESWGSDTEKMDDPTVDAARLYQTATWQTLVCEPWKRGMFGAGASAESVADEYGKDFWKLQVMSGRSYDESDQDEIDDEWTEMADEIAEENPGVHTVLVGRNSGVRTDAAISAFGASIILGGVLGIVAFSVAILRVAVMFML
ncbi:hypothetical protein, partial [Nocardiopsis halophila]|uniref:hypothetical protein n=1 Tax=Nocardiopsis halophila TaxID=141692 RepID=UPI00126974E0